MLERSQYAMVESCAVLLFYRQIEMKKKEDSIDESIPMLMHIHDNYLSFPCLSRMRNYYQDHYFHRLLRQTRDSNPVPMFASIHPDRIAFAPSMR